MLRSGGLKGRSVLTGSLLNYNPWTMRAAEFLPDVKETLERRGEDIDGACGQLAEGPPGTSGGPLVLEAR